MSSQEDKSINEQNLMQEWIITKIKNETDTAITFTIYSENKAYFRSGQFITLVFEKPERQERRSYSISSIPDNTNEIDITIKKVDNGEYSRYLLNHAHIGMKLISSGIHGLFTLPDNPIQFKQYFFLAAGSGITPIFSIIQYLRQYHSELPIHLIYSNRSVQDTIFYKELELLREESKGLFNITYLFSQSENLLRARLNNFLLIDLLASYTVSNAQEIGFYICGPVEYMDTVSITLLTEGVPSEHIKKENFNAFKPEIKEVPEDQSPHEVTVHFRNGIKKFISKYPDSILHSALNAGIQLPYSCESGQCGSCTAICTQGEVWIAYNEVLTKQDLAKGFILTCQSFPVNGDIEIRY